MKQKKRWGFEVASYPFSKRAFVDIDYTNKLNEAEKDWLSKFMDEYYKGRVKKGDVTAIHSTDELRKDCYKRNNKNNKDIYGKAFVDELSDENSVYSSEDEIIEMLDKKKETK